MAEASGYRRSAGAAPPQYTSKMERSTKMRRGDATRFAVDGTRQCGDLRRLQFLRCPLQVAERVAAGLA